jgi:hypothetical protein
VTDDFWGRVEPWLSVGDWEANTNAVGVPLINPDDEEMMAFNWGGPALLLPRPQIPVIVTDAPVGMVLRM